MSLLPCEGGCGLIIDTDTEVELMDDDGTAWCDECRHTDVSDLVARGWECKHIRYPNSETPHMWEGKKGKHHIGQPRETQEESLGWLRGEADKVDREQGEG